MGFDLRITDLTIATLDPWLWTVARHAANSVTFSMARSVTFSMAIDS